MKEPNELLNDPGRVYRRLFGYTLRYWKVFALAILFSGLNAATDTGIVYLMKPLLDGSFVEKDPKVIAWIPLAFLILIMLRGVFAYLAAFHMSWVGRRVVHDVRTDIFDQFLRLPVHFYDHQAYGNLLTRLTYHVEQVAESVTTAIATMVREGMTALGMIALLFYLNWKMAIFVLIIAPLVAVLVRIINKRFRRYSVRIQDSMGDVTHVGSQATVWSRCLAARNTSANISVRLTRRIPACISSSHGPRLLPRPSSSWWLPGLLQP
jgi:ATP-binding cassette, subfamily B, bacterial MsbA